MKDTFTNSERTIQLFVLQSSLTSIDDVEMLLKRMKRQLDLPGQIYCAIWISVNEAISNAIIHGNKFDLQKKVRLIIHLKQKDWISFTVKDEGEGFDYENIPNPTHQDQEFKPYGRGIFFMKKLADAAFFSDKGTTVDLIFNLNRP